MSRFILKHGPRPSVDVITVWRCSRSWTKNFWRDSFHCEIWKKWPFLLMWEIILLFVHAQWSSISFVLKIGCLYFMLNWRLCMLLFHLIGCGFLFKSVSKTSLDCLQFCSWSLSYQYGHVSLIQREGTLLVWTENVIFICSNLFQNYYHTCLNCCLGFKVRINFRLT